MSLTRTQRFGWLLMRIGMKIAGVDYADVIRFMRGGYISIGIWKL